MVTNINELGRLIAAIRSLRGWSQAELARRSSVSHPYISRAENGKVILSQYHLDKIQTALGVSFDAIRPAFEQFAAAVLSGNGGEEGGDENS